MIDFFSNFGIQIVVVLAVFGILFVTSRLRKPKAGEVSVEQILEKLSIIRITLIGPLMLWFLPVLLGVFYFSVKADDQSFAVFLLTAIIPVFYLGWMAGAMYPLMIKRNFITARLQYMKDPKGYNKVVVDGPIVAKRLALYPKALRKVFFFLADAKWF